MALIPRTGVAAFALMLAGCSTSSHVMLGPARPPISPDSVTIFSYPPQQHYEQIAHLDATSQGSFAITSQQNMDKAIARLKVEAAKLGANGVILQGVADQQSGSIGAGGSNTSYGGSSSVGVGVGGSFGIYNKAVTGLAIYVPPGAQPPPPAQWSPPPSQSSPPQQSPQQQSPPPQPPPQAPPPSH
jgi:hypothetical protein